MKGSVCLRIGFAVCLFVLGAAFLAAQVSPTAERPQISLIRAQHLRLPLPAEIQRIAVGDTEILSAEALNNRELLLLGKTSGRTSLMIWFRDGSVREYIVLVHRDLSLLQSTLRRIDPSIEAEIAPDRDAIVLTGQVQTIFDFQRAEVTASNYLKAGPANANQRYFDAGSAQAPQPAPQPGQPQPAQGALQPGVGNIGGSPATPGPPPPQVINLIHIVGPPPPTPEQKITEAISPIGGSAVTIRRILKGQLRDDTQDIFVLEGRVPNQVALTRILTLAAEVVTGQVNADQDIHVLADEAGGLAQGVGGQGGGAGGGGGIGGGIGGGGGLGGGGGNLNNQLRRNIARSKAISAGNGRILSLIDVADLPQVRVSIRLYEVNRSKLRTYSSNFGTLLATGTNHIGSLVPSSVSTTLQGGSAQPVGPGTAVQNALGFLAGTFSNETQLTTGRFALDALFSYLEQQGLARSLSSPSLTVLSGEVAQFQVGGDIPIPQVTTLGASGTSQLGVFSSVSFVTFGVELGVRPLVGDDDMLTLDVSPVITTPDTTLTKSIQQASGTNPTTTAFQTRSLRTSARLQDGEGLLIGGLLSRTTNDTNASTPGLRDVPGFGWLFKNLFSNDSALELVIVVNPVIVRDPLPNVRLWEYPTSSELMDKFGKGILATPAGGDASAPVRP